jgi:hypothetical protein
MTTNAVEEYLDQLRESQFIRREPGLWNQSIAHLCKTGGN